MQTRTNASLLIFTLIGACVLARPALAEPSEQQIEPLQQRIRQQIESPPKHHNQPPLGDFLFDGNPHEAPDISWRPKSIRQKYQEDATVEILQKYKAPKDCQPITDDDVVIMITVSRSGKISQITAVRTSDEKPVNSKAFAAVIKAIRSIKLDPIPDRYQEEELTFKFDASRLGMDNSDAKKLASAVISDTEVGETTMIGPLAVKPVPPKYPATKEFPTPPTTPKSAIRSFDPNDPDSGNPAMQLAWVAWRHRLRTAIYIRYTAFARAAFHHSPPLHCSATFTVTKDGHIEDLRMETKSANVLYNVLVLQAIKSVSGDQTTLQFPPGSKRLSARIKITTVHGMQYGMDYEAPRTYSELELLAPDDEDSVLGPE